MQTNAPIESFKSMMFKKAEGPSDLPYFFQDNDNTHFADVKFGDLQNWFHNTAQAREAAERGKARDDKPTLYEQMLFRDFTSNPRSDVSARVGEARRTGDWRDRKENVKVAGKESRRENRYGRTPYHETDIRGANGEIISDENFIIRAFADEMGRRLAREFVRTGGKAAPIQVAEKVVYDMIKDAKMRHNEIGKYDTNLGLKIAEEITHSYERALRADKKAQMKAAEEGRQWDPKTSKVAALPYGPDMTLRDFITKNAPQIYNLALNKGAHYLRNMAYQGGGKNANISNEFIQKFVNDTKAVTEARGGDFGYSNPNLDSKADMFVNGKPNKKNVTVANTMEMYPPTHIARRRNPSDPVVVKKIGEAAANTAIDTQGNFDLGVLINDQLRNYPGVALNKGLEDDIITEMIYGQRGLLNRGYSDKAVSSVMNAINTYADNQKFRTAGGAQAYADNISDLDNRPKNRAYSEPGPKPYDSSVRDETLRGMADTDTDLRKQIETIDERIKEAETFGDPAERQRTISELSTMRQELLDRHRKINEHLDETGVPKADKMNINLDDAAYHRAETGSIHSFDSLGGIRGGQAYNGDEMGYYLNGLDKLYMRDDKLHEGVDGGSPLQAKFLEDFKAKLAQMDDKDASARFIQEVETNGREGVKNVMKELMTSPAYTFTGDRYVKKKDADGNIIRVKEEGVQRPDVVMSLGQLINSYEGGTNKIVEERVKAGTDYEGRAFDPERYDKVEAMDLGAPAENQSTMSQGPTVSDAIITNRPNPSSERVPLGDPRNPPEKVSTKEQIATGNKEQAKKEYYNSPLRPKPSVSMTSEDSKTKDPKKDFEQQGEEWNKEFKDTKETSASEPASDEKKGGKKKSKGLSDDTTSDENITQKQINETKKEHKNNKKSEEGKKTMTEESKGQEIKTTPSKKSALDIPFSAMLKSANEKAGQEKGLPSGAVMKETLPAYYRTVKMVGDHPDAIGFSVYEHEKMNAEDGEEHKTDLPKPIKKGSIEYIEKSSIRDLIEGDHIAKRWQDEPQGSAPGDELEDEIQNGIFGNNVSEILGDNPNDVDGAVSNAAYDMTPRENDVEVARQGHVKFPVEDGSPTYTLEQPTLDAEINDAIDEMQDDPNNDVMNNEVVESSYHDPGQNSVDSYEESWTPYSTETVTVKNPKTNKVIAEKTVELED